MTTVPPRHSAETVHQDAPTVHRYAPTHGGPWPAPGPRPTPPPPAPPPVPPSPAPEGTSLRTVALVIGGAALVATLAAVAQVAGLPGAVLVLLAAGLILVVAPIGPLTARGPGAVSRPVALLLCLALALGGVLVGYGVRGGFAPGTPWASGVTGESGPRIPGGTAPPPTGPLSAPADPVTAPPPGQETTAGEPVALTDPSRSDLVVDDNGRLGVATTPVTVSGQSLTDAFRTYCACEPTAAQEGRLVVALGGTYRRLDAVLGVDQASRDSGRVRIALRDVASGRTLLEREVGFAAAVPVSVDVTGVQRLEIVVRGPLGGVTGVIGEPRVTP